MNVYKYNNCTYAYIHNILVYTINFNEMKRQTWSDSHSLVQVLIASTHKFGFMSFGQIPAWEYATLCKVMPLAHCLFTNSSKNCPETNQIQRGNSIHHMLEGRNENLFWGVTNPILLKQLSQNCAPPASRQQATRIKRSPSDSEYCESKVSLDLYIYSI